MSDSIEVAIQAMRAKHLELRDKLVRDVDRSSGYLGAGDIIADAILEYMEQEFKKQFQDAL